MSGAIRGISRSYQKTLSKINQMKEKMAALSDEQLQKETPRLKAMLQEGKSLDDILPEAYAAIREAAGRILGMYPFDVQVIGAIALHEGNIAEMKTGEGKTLVAVMPLYLNALTEKSVILVTTNEYLASRDGAQMGKLFRFMGLSTAVGVPKEGAEPLKPEEKREIYAADIVYTTNGTLGFDYLIENLATDPSKQFLREFYYVVVDEADAVLLDSAQTPLVISGAPKVQSNLYEMADDFVQTLKEERDYMIRDGRVWLTEAGMNRAEAFYRVTDFYASDNFELVRHTILALRAHACFERDRNYIVQDGKVILLDERSGRVLDNTKLRGGQHQALEAKEKVKITLENRAMAAITFQSFFRLFPKLAGMSGTAVQDKEEFRNTYGLKVIKVPTRRPMIRKDEKPVYYYSVKGQIYGTLQELKRLHEIGRPVLLVTESLDMADIFSKLLLQEGIAHNVLSAHNVAKEAEIIAEAGMMGAVTVATPIAGRGTDIKLGDGVDAIGGLAVLGVGCMANRRMEMQARGRAGRQGDHGSSRFFVSLNDEVIQLYGGEWLKSYIRRDGVIHSSRIRRAVERAQRISEGQAREARKATMNYDETTRIQREHIYALRRQIVQAKDIDSSFFEEIAKQVVREFLDEFRTRDYEEIPDATVVLRFVQDNVSYIAQNLDHERIEKASSLEALEDYLNEYIRQAITQKDGLFSNKEQAIRFMCRMTLQAIDDNWVEEVDLLQQLRMAVSGRSYAQRNVMYEYHREARSSYTRMSKKIRLQAIRNILLAEIDYQESGKAKIILP